MVQVAPSILSADFAYLAADCERVISPDNRMLHFDVMDGVFVPNLSVGIPVLQSLKKAIPWAFYDAHLMIVNPAAYVDAFADAGADGITIHWEAEGNPADTLRAIRQKGLVAGISLRPGTPVEDLFGILPLADMVLVMSVEPGFGGQSFMPEAPARIAALRKEAARQGHKLLLQVDGGINAETGPLCVEAGVDILVAGSSVFGAQDPARMVQTLRGR